MVTSFDDIMDEPSISYRVSQKNRLFALFWAKKPHKMQKTRFLNIVSTKNRFLHFFHINTSDSHVYTVFGYGEPIGVAFTKILQIFHDFFREKWHFQGKIWSKLELYCRYDFSSIRSSKNAFFAFYEVFWGRKIFWTPEKC